MKKCFGIILICSILMAGCGDKKVDYKVDGTTDNVITSTTEEVTNGWEKYAKWNETIKSVDANGKEIDVNINAEFMSTNISELADIDHSGQIVVYYETLDFSEAFKKKMVEYFFDKNTVYQFDDNVWPKIVVEATIGELEHAKASFEKDYGDNIVNTDSYKQLIEDINYYKELDKNAPDDFLKIEDYSGNRFLAFIDDNPYEVTFLEEEVDVVMNGHTTKHLRRSLSYGDVYEIGMTSYNNKDVEENYPSATLGEILNILKKTMTDLGIEVIYDNGILDSARVDNGELVSEIVDKEVQTTQYSGYQVGRWVRNVCNIDNILDNNFYVEFGGNKIEALRLLDPVQITGIERNVRILSVEDIKSAIRDVLEKKHDKLNLVGEGGLGNKITCESITLEYVTQISEDGTKALIPAWNVGNLFFINAIDGTPIFI